MPAKDRSLQTSLIVVTYNSSSTIQECINSLLIQAKAKKLIVVDNRSSDNTVAVVSKFPKVKLVKSATNLGFGAGNNLGLKEVNSDIVIFVNPDTILPRDFSKKILKSFNKHPKASIIGCRITNPDGSLQRTGNTFPTMRSLLYENSGYHKVFKNSKAYHRYIYGDWNRNTSRYIDAVSGACFACRKSFLDQIGGFDEKYFLFFEEFDLAKAAQRLGQKVYFDSSIAVEHVGGISTKQSNQDFINRTYKSSQDYYIKKNNGILFFMTYKLFVGVFYVLAKLYSLLGLNKD